MFDALLFHSGDGMHRVFLRRVTVQRWADAEVAVERMMTKQEAEAIVAPALSSDKPKQLSSPFFEIARVLVRLDHVASFIVNANHSIV